MKPMFNVKTWEVWYVSKKKINLSCNSGISKLTISFEEKGSEATVHMAIKASKAKLLENNTH